MVNMLKFLLLGFLMLGLRAQDSVTVCNGGDECCDGITCGLKEGDCDSHEDCVGHLRCGVDNCDGPGFDSTDDCCWEDPAFPPRPSKEDLEKCEIAEDLEKKIAQAAVAQGCDLPKGRPESLSLNECAQMSCSADLIGKSFTCNNQKKERTCKELMSLLDAMVIKRTTQCKSVLRGLPPPTPCTSDNQCDAKEPDLTGRCDTDKDICCTERNTAKCCLSSDGKSGYWFGEASGVCCKSCPKDVLNVYETKCNGENLQEKRSALTVQSKASFDMANCQFDESSLSGTIFITYIPATPPTRPCKSAEDMMFTAMQGFWRLIGGEENEMFIERVLLNCLNEETSLQNVALDEEIISKIIEGVKGVDSDGNNKITFEQFKQVKLILDEKYWNSILLQWTTSCPTVSLPLEFKEWVRYGMKSVGNDHNKCLVTSCNDITDGTLCQTCLPNPSQSDGCKKRFKTCNSVYGLLSNCHTWSKEANELKTDCPVLYGFCITDGDGNCL